MDKFFKELTKKRTFAKNAWNDWYDWLINYTPEPIKNCGRGERPNYESTKNYSKPKRVKTVYGGGKKKSKENIIKSIKNLFKLKK